MVSSEAIVNGGTRSAMQIGSRQDTGLGIALSAKSGEMAAASAAAQSRAEIEAAYTIAMHRPRNIDDSRARILEACKRVGFAEVARYAKPVGNQSIVGPSIRFAELAIQCYRNVRVSSSVLYEDDDIRKIHITVTDLEGNMSYGKDVTLQKTVERKNLRQGSSLVGERQNTKGERVFIVRATEDELINKTNAIESKVIRQCGLRLIPQDIIEEAMSVVEKTLIGGISDPSGQKKKISDAFSEIGIMPSELEKYLSHTLAQITTKEILELRSIYAAIKDGESTWSDYMAIKQNAPTRASISLDDLAPGKTETHVPVSEPIKKKVETVDIKTGEIDELAEAQAAIEALPAIPDDVDEKQLKRRGRPRKEVSSEVPQQDVVITPENPPEAAIQTPPAPSSEQHETIGCYVSSIQPMGENKWKVFAEDGDVFYTNILEVSKTLFEALKAKRQAMITYVMRENRCIMLGAKLGEAGQ